MADTSFQLGWSEVQWSKVNSTVTDEFSKASVVGKFLPCYGPLAGSAETVRDEKLDLSKGGQVRVSDDGTLKLWNLTVNVELSNQQINEESLSSALLAFRRAANKLAKVEDYIVLSGYALSTRAPRHLRTPLSGGVAPNDLSDIVTSGDQAIGLTEEGDSHTSGAGTRRGFVLSLTGSRGETIVQAVARAILALEASSHLGPFACVLGHGLFLDAHSPDPGSLVLPADRIAPMLNGPLLRSSSMESNVGIVVSLSGEPIDLVVATPPKVQFLQITDKAKHVFRVYERFVLRIKEDSSQNPGAVYTFSLPSQAASSSRNSGANSKATAGPKGGRRSAATRKRVKKSEAVEQTLT